MKNFLIIFALLLVGCGGRQKDAEIERLNLQVAQFQSEISMRDSTARVLTDSLAVLDREIEKARAKRPISGRMVDSLVRIRYTNTINGYRVSVLWQPDNVGFMGQIIGKAIINFRKGNRSFSMVHSHFFIGGELGNAKGLRDEEPLWLDWSSLYEIEYPTPAQSSGITLHNDLPFFFTDNGRMLVLTMWDQGQRHTNAYRFYKASDWGVNQDDLYESTYEKPFVDIDDLTKFDGNRITLHTSGGAYHWVEEIYDAVDSSRANPYELTEIREYDEDTLRVFKIKKQLIKKEYSKQ